MGRRRALRLRKATSWCGPLLPASRQEKGVSMADLAYALVFIGVFLVLALSLRGLERL